MVAEAESAWEDHRVVFLFVEFIMPYELSVEFQAVLQNMNGVSITIASGELDNSDLQFSGLTLTLSECATGL